MSKEFASEAEMCAAFLRVIPPNWVPFAETHDWDILLVRKQDGLQIGIQAKLTLNGKVFDQAAEKYGAWAATNPGPDFRAVLVPDGGLDLGAALYYLPITIIRVWKEKFYSNTAKTRFSPDLPPWRDEGPQFFGDKWFEQCPTVRHKLPDYVPDVAAGARSPVQLSPWKIKALKLCVVMERNGHLTRADFKAYAVDPRHFLNKDLLLPTSGKFFLAGPRLSAFKAQHPTVYAQIAADYDKWAKAEKPKARQQTLNFGG